MPVLGRAPGLVAPVWLPICLVSSRGREPPTPLGVYICGCPGLFGRLTGMCLPLSVPDCDIPPLHKGSCFNPRLYKIESVVPAKVQAFPPCLLTVGGLPCMRQEGSPNFALIHTREGALRVGRGCPAAFQTPLSSELNHLFFPEEDFSSPTPLPGHRVQSLAWGRTLRFHLFAQHCSYFLQATKLMVPRQSLLPSVPRLALLRFPPLTNTEKGMPAYTCVSPPLLPWGWRGRESQRHNPASEHWERSLYGVGRRKLRPPPGTFRVFPELAAPVPRD